jgi:hypothetical protein
MFMRALLVLAMILGGLATASADDHADCRALADRFAAASGASIAEDVGVRIGLNFPPGHVFAQNHVDVRCPVGAFGASVVVTANDSSADARLLMVTLAGALGHVMTGDTVPTILAGATKCVASRINDTWDGKSVQLPASEIVCAPAGRIPNWVEVDKLGLSR